MRCYDPDRDFDGQMDRIICNRCVHKRKGVTCDAFPKGIPQSVLRSGEHFTPIPDDNGIVFEEKRSI